MKLKKLLCTALSAALVCTAALAADTPAYDPGENDACVGLPLAPNGEKTGEETPAYTLSQDPMLPVMVWGTAHVEEGRVLVTNDNEGAKFPELLLSVTEETAILDAVTGAVKNLEDVRDGETVYAYAGPALAPSLPPQAHAAILLCNFPADFGSPIYAEVQRVTAGEDGKISVLMTDDIVLHLSADTELLAYGAKNVPTLEDIRPGTRLLSWYTMVMESFPAQAVPSKVMVFPYGYAGYAELNAGEASVNGTALAAAPVVEEGSLQVPLRAFAEALGCEVIWDAAAGTATVRRDGQELYSLHPGEDTAVVEGDMVVTLSAPSRIRGGLTYAAAQDLLAWHELKLVGNWPLI